MSLRQGKRFERSEVDPGAGRGKREARRRRFSNLVLVVIASVTLCGCTLKRKDVEGQCIAFLLGEHKEGRE